MLALQITSLKSLMNQLLVGSTFDDFLLEQAMIRTAVTYTIDGRINKEFYPAEERTEELLPYEFRPWSEIKGLCFDLIKGKHTPLSFQFVFHLKPEKTEALLASENVSALSPQLKALVLNLRYDGARAMLTTGTSYHSFVLDREIDALWDQSLTKYLSEKGIAYTEPNGGV